MSHQSEAFVVGPVVIDVASWLSRRTKSSFTGVEPE
jgi:hypothetical protein